MSKEVKRKRRRKLSFQKLFNVASFTFILACCIFYGSRLITFYLKANPKVESKTLTSIIIKNNQDSESFKEINKLYYFTGKDSNNYLTYSNLTWRIIRINQDNTITLVLDNSITALASGENKNFEESYLNTWLNYQDKEYTGILEKSLNNTNKYLTYTNTCNDIIDDTKNISCKTTTEDTYITVPSLTDYVNTGSSKSFMNNDEYFYLTNTNKNNKTWYVEENGKVSTSNGTDIYGIKPVITLKSTIELKDGNGTKENPYTFEEETSLFGSYVKLGNDIWRIYKVEENEIKLSLNNYLQINNTDAKYKYSNNGYYHNDTKAETLAYYLKNNYLEKLSYKNIVNEVKYSNGIYGNTNNYNYIETLKTTVPTKVTTLSIGDIFLNSKLTNYYTSTGLSSSSTLVYTIQNNFNINTKISTTELKIVPVISIKKDLLTKGNGTQDSPYEVE